MNGDLVKLALEKVGNPAVLVNIISRRVRQINAGAGGMHRPLVGNIENLGTADIALREIIEGKMGWVESEPVKAVRPVPKKRRFR